MNLLEMKVVYISGAGKAVMSTIQVEEKPKSYRVINYNGVPANRVLIPKNELDTVVFEGASFNKLFSFRSDEEVKEIWNTALQVQSQKIQD